MSARDLPGRRFRRELARLLRGESRNVLLAGVALNWIGAAKIGGEVCKARARADAPIDYEQMKAFTAGTAATFGSYYLYLYLARKPAFPWLMFGAALKMWAFALSAVLFSRGRLDRASFASFGASNGIVGGLMWAHVAADARRRRR